MPTFCVVCGRADGDDIGEPMCHFAGGHAVTTDACVDVGACVVPVRLRDVHVHPSCGGAETAATAALARRRSAHPISEYEVVSEANAVALFGEDAPDLIVPVLRSTRSAVVAAVAAAATATNERRSGDEDPAVDDNTKKEGDASSGSGNGGAPASASVEGTSRYYLMAEVRSAVDAARAAATASLAWVGTAGAGNDGAATHERFDDVNEGDVENVASFSGDAKCGAKRARAPLGGASMKPAPKKAKEAIIATPDEEAERDQLEGCRRYCVRYLAPSPHSPFQLEGETLEEQRERHFQMQQLRDEAYYHELASPGYRESIGKGEVSEERKRRDACLRYGVRYLPPPTNGNEETAEDRKTRINVMAQVRNASRRRTRRWAADRDAPACATVAEKNMEPKKRGFSLPNETEGSPAVEEIELLSTEGCGRHGLPHLPPPHIASSGHGKGGCPPTAKASKMAPKWCTAIETDEEAERYQLEGCRRFGVRYLAPPAYSPSQGRGETLEEQRERHFQMHRLRDEAYYRELASPGYWELIGNGEVAERKRRDACLRCGVRYLPPPTNGDEETAEDRKTRLRVMAKARNASRMKTKRWDTDRGSPACATVAEKNMEPTKLGFSLPNETEVSPSVDEDERLSTEGFGRHDLSHLPPPHIASSGDAKGGAKGDCSNTAKTSKPATKARKDIETDEEAERYQLEGCRRFGVRYLAPPQKGGETKSERRERLLEMQLLRDEAYLKKVDVLASLGYVRNRICMGRDSCLRYGIRYLPPPTKGDEETVEDRKARIKVMTKAMNTVRNNTKNWAARREASARKDEEMERLQRHGCERYGVPYLPPRPASSERGETDDERWERFLIMQRGRDEAYHEDTRQFESKADEDEEGERRQRDGCLRYAVRYRPPPMGADETEDQRRGRFGAMKLERKQARDCFRHRSWATAKPMQETSGARPVKRERDEVVAASADTSLRSTCAKQHCTRKKRAKVLPSEKGETIERKTRERCEEVGVEYFPPPSGGEETPDDCRIRLMCMKQMLVCARRKRLRTKRADTKGAGGSSVLNTVNGRRLQLFSNWTHRSGIILAIHELVSKNKGRGHLGQFCSTLAIKNRIRASMRSERELKKALFSKALTTMMDRGEIVQGENPRYYKLSPETKQMTEDAVRRRSSAKRAEVGSGNSWSDEEIRVFIDAFELYGREKVWTLREVFEKVSLRMRSRTAEEVETYYRRHQDRLKLPVVSTEFAVSPMETAQSHGGHRGETPRTHEDTYRQGITLAREKCEEAVQESCPRGEETLSEDQKRVRCMGQMRSSARCKSLRNNPANTKAADGVSAANTVNCERLQLFHHWTYRKGVILAMHEIVSKNRGRGDMGLFCATLAIKNRVRASMGPERQLRDFNFSKALKEMIDRGEIIQGENPQYYKLSPELKQRTEDAVRQFSKATKTDVEAGDCWSDKEITLFLDAFELYGHEEGCTQGEIFKKVSVHMRSRTAEEVDTYYRLHRDRLKLPILSTKISGSPIAMPQRQCELRGEAPGTHEELYREIIIVVMNELGRKNTVRGEMKSFCATLAIKNRIKASMGPKRELNHLLFFKAMKQMIDQGELIRGGNSQFYKLSPQFTKTPMQCEHYFNSRWKQLLPLVPVKDGCGEAEQRTWSAWTADEDRLLVEAYGRYGGLKQKWKNIGAVVKTRTAQQCSDYFRYHRDRLLPMVHTSSW